MLKELRGLRHSDQTRSASASVLVLSTFYVNLYKVHTQAHRRREASREGDGEVGEKGRGATLGGWVWGVRKSGWVGVGGCFCIRCFCCYGVTPAPSTTPQPTGHMETFQTEVEKFMCGGGGGHSLRRIGSGLGR